MTTLADGAGTSSATFEGTISHTNALTATTPLVCYVKDQNNPSAVTVNADGSYTYTSSTLTSQDGTMAGAAKCNLYYGMTHYGDGTHISCNFSVNTSMMKFTVDASGLTSGSATLSYKSNGTTIAAATFTVAADGKNTVYMAIPAMHLTGEQTLQYVSTSNSIDITATLSDTQANFAAGQTYSKTIVVLNPSTGAVTAPNGAIVCGMGGSSTHLTIADGATVKLDGASINTSGEHAGITCAGDATINLRGTNTVQASDSFYPGIYVPSGSTLTIGGSGSLTATGGDDGAGIGSRFYVSCGDITIANTVTSVTATKGRDAPNSIGASDNGTCGTVRIGGTVYWNGSAYQNGGEAYLNTSPLVYEP